MYIAALNSRYFDARVFFLSKAYELYLSELLEGTGSYAFNRSELKSILVDFFSAQEGDDAKLILEKLDGKINSFIRKPFKDRIRILFEEQGIVCDEKLLGTFVKARHKVVHSLGMLSPGDIKSTRSITYMLRQFEVLTLKMMGYTGEFQDRFNDYRLTPFAQMLEELTRETAESD